ncbi:hypothetical protein ACIQUQ_00670 [Streptomyces sp. NPDC101118]|uniref:hypothetical protein n=1 Tax=Streptomyces sp. NPDC101118 TaxID=3366109 RepID=UPI0038005D4B
MRGEEHRAAEPRTAPGQERHCPVCGRPVEEIVHRRKVLGAFVPEWGPGPCRNPDCPAYAPGGEAGHRR